jgi:6-methylsalicylate decarboxylase
LVDPGHILFGSDFPFAPEPLTANQITMLERGDVWSVDQTRAIMRNNALALFPRFSKQDEGALERRAHRTLSIGGRVQNALHRPVLAVAERMRNR